DWPGKFPAIPWVYAEIVRQLHLSERVHILLNDKKAEGQVLAILKRADVNLKQIQIYRYATNRVWTRDYGPIFIQDANRQLAVLDWKFNAWAKYPNWQSDDAIPKKIVKALRLKSWQPTWNGRRV